MKPGDKREKLDAHSSIVGESSDSVGAPGKVNYQSTWLVTGKRKSPQESSTWVDERNEKASDGGSLHSYNFASLGPH